MSGTLSAAGRRFRSLIENSSDVITVLAADGSVLYESPSSLTVLGYKPEELIGDRRFGHVHEDDLPRVLDGFARVVSGERVVEQYRYRHRDGSWRWLESTAINRIEDPDVQGIVVNTRDVTAAHEAQEALVTQERHYRALIEHSHDGIMLLDESGAPLYVSPAVLRIIGFEPEELVGANLIEMIHPDDRAVSGAVLGTLLSGGAPSVHHSFRFPHKRGGWRWMEATARSLTGDPGGRAFVANFRDMTEQKQTEEAVRFQAHVLHAVEQAVAVTDLNGVIVYWNRFAESLYGWTEEEAIGQPLTNLLRTGEKYDERSEIVFERRSGESWSGEFQVKRRDGSTFVAMMINSPLRDDNGTLVGIIGVSWDITDQKAAQAAVQDVNTALEERVRQRTAELEAANRELESFCYAVSHDLRAPLRAVSGFTQAALDEFSTDLPPQCSSYLSRAVAAGQRMEGLIDALLQLSQVVRMPMHRVDVDLSALARETVRELEIQHPNRDVEALIADHALGDGDPHLLRVVLVNLLENAWKYTRDRKLARVEFGMTEKDGERIYFVTDNGAGFDMEFTDKLFRPFQRLHSTHEFEGTGIGLATVQRIVHRHGGRIWAESSIDRGTTFFFTLE